MLRASRVRAPLHQALRAYSTPRKSELDIHMLAPRLHSRIFKEQRFAKPTKEQVSISIDHLKSQNIYGKETESIAHVDFEPPPLLGPNIDMHFQNIGNLVAEPYLSMAREFAMHACGECVPRPDKDAWRFESGWTRYTRDGTATRVACPDESDDVLVFDVEVLVPESPYPIMATAVGRGAWYGWVSPYLTGESKHARHLVPLMHPEQTRPRIVIGHNVGYDRARVQEERSVRRRPLAYLDTMSLHVSSGGLCNQQRLHWVKYSKAKRDKDEEFLRLNADTGKFFDVSSLNSLKEVALHYCGIEMDKSRREYFVDGTLADIRDRFNSLIDYCALDVEITLHVYQKVLLAFLTKCPHPVSFAGMLMMSDGYLPVDESWDAYIARSEALLTELSSSVSAKLVALGEEALKNKAPMDDPWLRHLDWTAEPQKFTKPKYKKDGSYAKNGEPKPYANQRLPGYPKWYKDLWDPKLNRIHVTVRSRIAPYLLKLKWLGFPLYHSALYGWTFRVPYKDAQAAEFCNMRALEFPTDPAHDDYEEYPAHDTSTVYFKVPHKDGETANCGNPLAKGYQTAIDDGTLTSAYAMAREAMEMNAKCSYWISARERVKSQFVTWDGDVEDAFTGKPLNFGLPHADGKKLGVILPMVVPMGTITRRGVESTWMTASNAKKNRLGSELKSMIRCPPGYRFVGADVDSEELWISALIGDSQFRMHGATAFGWMTLQGTKAAGTDLHSNTASILGIGRGSAKIFNYGRIYGAGVKYATSLLLQFNPDMTEATAREKAERLYAATKGTNMRSKRHFGRTFWHGGTESFMFNELERIATSQDPRTPVLNCGITDALRKEVTGDRYMTSRVNWVVQSSGVDYLHLLLTSMAYLARVYRIDMRFVISVHDEVRFLVPEYDTHRVALALQIANLWVRSLFSYRLGIEDLPQSVAFFSAVDVDHVLRKEVDMDCITPTNTTPIAPGKSYTIAETLELTSNGRLDVPPEQRNDVEKRMHLLSEPARLPSVESLMAAAAKVETCSTSDLSFVYDERKIPNLALPKGVKTSPAVSKLRKPAGQWTHAKHKALFEIVSRKLPDDPNMLWLTAQMLGANAEIDQLFDAALKQCNIDARRLSTTSKIRVGTTTTRSVLA